MTNVWRIWELFRPALAIICLVGQFVAGAGQAAAQPPGLGAELERCRTIADDAARLRCFEEMAAKPAPNAAVAAPVPDIGPWRLVRTPNPNGGRDAVSIMRTADITKSDLDLAGLTIRCAEGGAEILIVLVRPLPPRTHPTVIANAAGDNAVFFATLVPPGAAILLPKEASLRLTGAWKDAAALSFAIESAPGDDEKASIRGVVALSGLAQAEQLLLANCRSP